MTSIPKPDLRDYLADLRGPHIAEEWRSGWSIVALYRRPGAYCAYFAAQMGLHPTTLSYVAFAVAVTLPVQAALWGGGFAPWAVCLTAILFQVLDCADGTLARVTHRTSQRGADLDFLIDMAQWALLYTSIGILADRASDSQYLWTAIGAAAAWARLMARVVRDRLASAPSKAPEPVAPTNWPSVILGGISGLLPFLALTGSALPLAVGFLLVYALLDIGEGLAPMFGK